MISSPGEEEGRGGEDHAETEAEIKALAPQDRIDVQSFIWVVGKYRVEHEAGLT